MSRSFVVTSRFLFSTSLSKISFLCLWSSVFFYPVPDKPVQGMLMVQACGRSRETFEARTRI